MNKQEKDSIKKILCNFIDEAEHITLNINNEKNDAQKNQDRYKHFSGWKDIAIRAFSVDWMSK